jgi:phosphoglycolate phosphatase
MKRKYQYLLFDLDGTLTDSKPGITKCVQYSLEKMGRAVPPEEELLCFIGPPLIVSYQEYCGMTKEEAEMATAFYRERYEVTGLYENDVYGGILEALGKLKNAGYILAVATSKPEPYLVKILAHFHLDEYFTVIAGSGLSGERNSKTEVIQDALSQLAVWKSGKSQPVEEESGMFYRGEKADPAVLEEIKALSVMIGDRHHDIDGAKNCGIDSMGVRYGYAKEGELKEAGAVYEVASVEEMCGFFLAEDKSHL